MTYAHIRLAKEAGLEEEIRKAVTTCERGCGFGWTLHLDLAWDLLNSMLESKGHISSTLWQEAKQELGEETLLAVVQLSAAYQYQANLLNAHCQEIPPGEELLA